jgi:hypothetical protein
VGRSAPADVIGVMPIATGEEPEDREDVPAISRMGGSEAVSTKKI